MAGAVHAGLAATLLFRSSRPDYIETPKSPAHIRRLLVLIVPVFQAGLH